MNHQALLAALIAALLTLTATPTADAGDFQGPNCRELLETTTVAAALLCQYDGGIPGDASDRCRPADRHLEEDSYTSGRVLPENDEVDWYILDVPDPAPAQINFHLTETALFADPGYPDLKLVVRKDCADPDLINVHAAYGSAMAELVAPEPGIYHVAVRIVYNEGVDPQGLEVFEVQTASPCAPTCDRPRGNVESAEKMAEEGQGLMGQLLGGANIQVRNILTYVLHHAPYDEGP
ncbi:MAG: hypothetical protein ACPGQL_04020 [Thermoplasmatota archaeon]